MDLKRIKNITSFSSSCGGNVLYWMSRDQRVDDNWALVYAQKIALERKCALHVVFCLQKNFLNASQRNYIFMLKGLKKVSKKLDKLNIGFSLLIGKPQDIIPQFINDNKVGFLVTDFSPLREKRQWRESLVNKISISFQEVDSHNIVPVWIASEKQEYSARTIRGKISYLLPHYLTHFPGIIKHPYGKSLQNENQIEEKINSYLKINFKEHNFDWIKPGEDEALNLLKYFLENKLSLYSANKNDPAKDGQSNLSAYLHFGMISAQRVVFEAEKFPESEGKKQFLEELIIRRELSDNFCYYNQDYDNFNGLPKWGRETLKKGMKDKRDYIYSLEDLEKCQTHDKWWNVAQYEMKGRGKMHGYLRMYWAKKILEWSVNPQIAINNAVYLNDKFQLDGRDPNGYCGILWSIGGLHDRPWFNRPVFGLVRFMSQSGLDRQFSLKQYMERVGFSV